MFKRLRKQSYFKGFTLIELLIVVAIIAILAAIAVPNFLEAQVRAKVSRCRADMRTIHTAVTLYISDNNVMFPDSNDPHTPLWQKDLKFEEENPGVAADLQYRGNVDGVFYTFTAFRPLTTPIAYITFRPRDPFSMVMPYGMDTRYINGKIRYGVIFSGGPDHYNGDWYRGNSPTGKAIPYNATNGTKSRGDIWRLVQSRGDDFKREFGFDY